MCSLGKLLDESAYIFDIVKGFAVNGPNGGVKFHYHLGPTSVCRAAFCVALGLSCDSSRVKKYETLIRQGADVFEVQVREGSGRGTSKQEFAQCFVMAFVMVNSEKSPTKKLVLLEPQSLPEVFGEYIKYFNNINVLAKTTFRKVWYATLKLPLPDPVTNVLYTIKPRKRAKCGFKRCDKCCTLQFAIYV